MILKRFWKFFKMLKQFTRQQNINVMHVTKHLKLVLFLLKNIDNKYKKKMCMYCGKIYRNETTNGKECLEKDQFGCLPQV